MRGQKTVEANLNPVAADVHRRPSDQQSTINNQKSPSVPRLRLELVLHRRVKCDLLLFGSAPCSAGWSTMRRPVYLGLLPVPKEGVHDITALYLARFRAPGPNEQVFIRSCQQRHGWESAPQDHSALVPPKPAPLPPPAPNGQFPILNSQFSIGPRRSPSSILHPLWLRLCRSAVQYPGIVHVEQDSLCARKSIPERESFHSPSSILHLLWLLPAPTGDTPSTCPLHKGNPLSTRCRNCRRPSPLLLGLPPPQIPLP